MAKLVADLEPYLNYQGQFKIKINKQMNCLRPFISRMVTTDTLSRTSPSCVLLAVTPHWANTKLLKYRWRLDEYR